MTDTPLRIIHRLISWRFACFLVAAVTAALLLRSSFRVQFDHSIENMFAPGDALLEPYERLKRTFGGNEIVLALYEDEHLLEEQGLARLAARREELAQVSGVKSVLSLDQMLVEKENPLVQGILSLARDQLITHFEGFTHSADRKTASLFCMLTTSESATVSRRRTIDMLQQKVSQYPAGLIAGEPVLVVEGFRHLEDDSQRLGWISTILLGTTVLVCFRSLRWVVIPLVVVQWTLITTRATLFESGLRMSIVSSTLTAVVTVVGVATVIHVIVQYQDALRRRCEPIQALTRAGSVLAAPIFWACTTDAVGFFSLQTARVGPIRDFGVMMAIGCLFVVPAVAVVLPGLALFGHTKSIILPPPAPRPWLDKVMQRLTRGVMQRPLLVVGATMAIVSVSAIGLYRLEVESDFTRNFRAGSPLIQSYVIVEDRLGGAGVLDVLIPVPGEEGDRLSWSLLQRILDLEHRLQHEIVMRVNDQGNVPRLTKVISLASTVVAGIPESLRNRPVPEPILRTILKQLQTRSPDFFQAFYAPNPDHGGHYYLRIMLKTKERQSASSKKRLIEQVSRISRDEFPDAEVTGYFVLLTHLIDSTLSDQWKTFGVALLGIGLMMLLAFRSWVYALIAMVPNILPIILVTGLFGWLGFRVNMGAAMIAAVSVGLSIDGSIHYIFAFRRSLRAGRSLQESLEAAYHTVGRAVVFSTIALVIGLSALCSSDFVPTIYFGALVSLAMLGGLLGNLIVLPALIRLVVRE